MLKIKSFDPHNVVLIDENGKEHTLTADGKDEFDQDIIEKIIGEEVSLQ